ncbi:MAG TPA: acyclic terpene utilization AtuA family protein [Acidimicrobiales bacterium]|nr:acyclic terpene utilization AtuA family protein [Acidimicrobiales bacterium]
MSAGAVRIANCSGFYGDRLAAAREMVDGGPIDVLTGDWLAELTMLILAKNQLRDPASGYARTFVTQMEHVMGDCLDRGIKVVSNAGGLSPRGCAAAVAEVADRLGLAPRIAYVEGDDLMPRLEELRAAGVDLRHLETGEPLGDRPVMTANAYLGGWGIAEALQRGADIVITGRVTDAALVVGPAAWHHRWKRDDWDALAGAVVAGHVIECGTQATGGNYAFFTEVPGLEHPGFPIAEVEADGSSVITKHPGHGGLVSVGTVTAQLLYEIGSPRYLNPDVTARFDSIRLSQEGPDRARISGVRGESPPPTTKVSLNYQGGWRSTTTLYLTGLDIDAKADLVERTLWGSFPGGREAFDEVDVALLRTDKPDPQSNEEAAAVLRITVKDRDERKVGRAFSGRVTEMALASYPGLYGGGLTAGASAYGVFWPAVVPAELVWQEVVLDGERTVVDPVLPPDPPVTAGPPTASPQGGPEEAAGSAGSAVRVPLGRLFGARSGDKGGNANLGVWARSEAAYAWLAGHLTPARLKELLPETAPLAVERHELPNLLALNFVIVGLLGEGVAANSRQDGQAKSLGEWLRARVVELPESLLGD